MEVIPNPEDEKRPPDPFFHSVRVTKTPPKVTRMSREEGARRDETAEQQPIRRDPPDAGHPERERVLAKGDPEPSKRKEPRKIESPMRPGVAIEPEELPESRNALLGSWGVAIVVHLILLGLLAALAGGWFLTRDKPSQQTRAEEAPSIDVVVQPAEPHSGVAGSTHPSGPGLPDSITVPTPSEGMAAASPSAPAVGSLVVPPETEVAMPAVEQQEALQIEADTPPMEIRFTDSASQANEAAVPLTEPTLANIGGLTIESVRLGVVLDISKSMGKYLPTVRREIEQSFPGAPVREVIGCFLDGRDGYGVTSAVTDLVNKEQVDAIFWFTDLEDPWTPDGVSRLQWQLVADPRSGFDRTALYVCSVSSPPASLVEDLILGTGGAWELRLPRATE